MQSKQYLGRLATKRNYYYRNREIIIAKNIKHRKEKWITAMKGGLAGIDFELLDGKRGKNIIQCKRCSYPYRMLGPHLDKHYQKHIHNEIIPFFNYKEESMTSGTYTFQGGWKFLTSAIKKGGDNDMAGEMKYAPYTYEEIKIILDARLNENKGSSEISELLSGTRSSGGINILLKHWDAFISGDESIYQPSAVIRPLFQRYQAENDIEGTPKETQPQKEEEPEKEVKEDVHLADRKFAELKEWYSKGGKIITDYIEAEVERRMEAANRDLQKKLEDAEAKAAKYQELENFFSKKS